MRPRESKSDAAGGLASLSNGGKKQIDVAGLTAWAVLAALVYALGYFELVDHRSIATGFLGWTAHICLFASLTICLLAKAPSAFPGLAVVAVVGLVAGALEVLEVVPTAPGNLPDWCFSILGAFGVWRASLSWGRPRNDVGMAFAILFLACGLFSASASIVFAWEDF